MQSTSPKLSIITVNLNNSDGLRLTVESIVTQQWKEFEFIVIDGGSTDGSIEVIKAFPDHINYWVSEPDSGIYNAMNKGIAVATGEYCLFLNSGDVLLPNITELICSSISSNFDIYYFDCLVSNNNKPPIRKTYPEKLNALFLYWFNINHQSALIRRTLLSQNKGYDETYKYLSDYKFWLEIIILRNASHKRINQPITLFDSTGVSSNWNPTLESERKRAQAETLPESLIRELDSYEPLKPFMLDYMLGKPIFKFTIYIYNSIKRFQLSLYQIRHFILKRFPFL